MKNYYFDYSAHTPAGEAVLEYFAETERSFIGNANSMHAPGFAAKEKIEQIQAASAALLGVEDSEIIFTSGATESNNLAIKGIARAYRHFGRHIIATALEHSSVSAPLTYLQELGWEIDLIGIGSDGRIDLDELKAVLREDTVLVCFSAVDSELGAVQPIAEIAEILRAYPNAHFHLDATQAIGKIPVDLSAADTVSLSSHKFYGICGSGILIKKNSVVLEPLFNGGASTGIYRSGTPALSLAAATECALKRAVENQESNYRTVSEINKDLRAFFASYGKVKINSPAEAIPHILNLSVEGVKGYDFRDALSKNGICVSVKSACSVDKMPSKAVMAVSRDKKRAFSSWRVSLSHLTTEEDIAVFKKIFDKCYKELTQ